LLFAGRLNWKRKNTPRLFGETKGEREGEVSMRGERERLRLMIKERRFVFTEKK